MKYKYRKRNFLDIILTDSRPVELPQVFTLAHFYKYLNESCNIKKLLEEIRIQNRAYEKAINDPWGAQWHSTPLKYHIFKNRFETREMSLLSPLAMIETALFFGAYEKEILSLSSDGGFSVRKHEPNDKIRYKSITSDNGITYSSSEEKSIEASGTFYKIYPCKYIKDYHSSNNWYKNNREYKYFGKIDYSKCFDSIYTHTFTWLVTNNNVDGKQYGQYKYFLNICDKYLQNINGSITNGIAVGPEVSRLMAEILSQNIDNIVRHTLYNKCNKIYGKDYSVSRFIDDIFIFADTEKDVEQIIQLYRDTAERFHFHLNEKKQTVGKLPYVWFEWKNTIKSVNDYIILTLFSRSDTYPYLVSINQKMIPTMKMHYQDMLAQYPDYQNKITAYVLTTIDKKLNKTKKPLFEHKKAPIMHELFLEIVFYFYSFSPSYNNTEKLLNIILKVQSQIPENLFKESMNRILADYANTISKTNTEDILDLFLFISLFKLELPYSIFNEFKQLLDDKNNPIIYAVALLLLKNNKIYDYDIAQDIQNKISDAINHMYNKKDFFLYDYAWWLYIFSNCPLLDVNCTTEIKNFLEEVKIEFNGKTAAEKSKIIVLDFLLDKTSNTFINWEMQPDEFKKYTYFTTYERTLINGYNVKNKKENDFIEEY